MDPVSVIGLASSVIGIIDVATKSISALRALRQRWQTADLTISLLISQLTTIKAALSQIEAWISNNLNIIQHYQLVMDLQASFESCEALLLFIDGQLSYLDWNDDNTLYPTSKIKAVLQDKTVKECATHLTNQSAALNLLLTALNCRSLSEKTALLQMRDSRRVLDQVKDDTSSLFCLRDSASIRSSLTAATKRSNLLDISFDFDEDLTATKVYHRQWRPLIREVLRRGKKAKGDSVDSRKECTNGLAPDRSSRSQIDSQAINVKVWVLGRSSSGVSVLPEVMSLLYEGHYDPELRRGHIYQVVLDTLDAVLDKMAESSLPLDETGTAAYAQLLLIQQTPIRIEKIPEWLQQAFISLWIDSWVRKCYHDSIESTSHPSATYFLNSIARIVKADYRPTLEDAAMSLVTRTLCSDVLKLPARMSSRMYTFVRWTPAGASVRRNWADEFEDLKAILFMADLAICKSHSTDGALVDEFDSTLQRFHRVYKLPWLAKKDIILIFLNIDRFSQKSPNFRTASNKQEENISKTTDAIVNQFVSLNEVESRQIHVIFADKDGSAKNLECLEGAVERILSKKAISTRRP